MKPESSQRKFLFLLRRVSENQRLIISTEKLFDYYIYTEIYTGDDSKRQARGSIQQYLHRRTHHNLFHFELEPDIPIGKEKLGAYYIVS